MWTSVASRVQGTTGLAVLELAVVAEDDVQDRLAMSAAKPGMASISRRTR